MLLGERAKIQAVELPTLLRGGRNEARLISQFVKTWAVVDDDEKAALVAGPVPGGDRERVVAAAIVHGMCRHYGHAPPDWVFGHRSPVPIHPISDRRLTVAGMRARIIMTASPVCREHNVWFSETLVSARRDIRPPEPPPRLKIRDYASRVPPDERLMSKDEILRLFEGLDSELAEACVRAPVRLVVAGGAAMCFLVDDRTTYDVDALNPALDAQLHQAVRRVADDQGLPQNWVNTDASAYADLGDPGFSSRTIFEGEFLTVCVPSLEHLLAMKLLSARDKDLPDAAWLARTLGLEDRGSLGRVVADVYDRFPDMRESIDWAGGYIVHVLDELDLQRQLEATD